MIPLAGMESRWWPRALSANGTESAVEVDLVVDPVDSGVKFAEPTRKR